MFSNVIKYIVKVFGCILYLPVLPESRATVFRICDKKHLESTLRKSVAVRAQYFFVTQHKSSCSIHSAIHLVLFFFCKFVIGETST